MTTTRLFKHQKIASQPKNCLSIGGGFTTAIFKFCDAVTLETVARVSHQLHNNKKEYVLSQCITQLLQFALHQEIQNQKGYPIASRELVKYGEYVIADEYKKTDVVKFPTKAEIVELTTESRSKQISPATLAEKLSAKLDTPLLCYLKDVNDNFKNRNFHEPIAILLHISSTSRLLSDNANKLLKDIKKKSSQKLFRLIQDPNSSIDEIKQLLRMGANCHTIDTDDIVSREDYCSVQLAVANGRNDIVKIFLEAGVKMNYVYWRNLNRMTLLMVAAKEGQEETVKLLIAAGAKLNALFNPNSEDERNYHSQTAINFAAENGHANIVQLLLDAGADPNLATNLYPSPLYSAARKGHVEVVKLLLESGKVADINKQELGPETWYKRTPLMAAVADQHIRMVELLLQHKADIYKTEISIDGGKVENALEMAKRLANNQFLGDTKNYHLIANLLESSEKPDTSSRLRTLRKK